MGVIGVGWWGTVGHLEPLSKNDRAELVALQSRTEAKAKQRAERYGVPRYYSDYRRMIDECRLDGVVIATTPNVHYEQARYALEHGVSVLMEKPFVFRGEQAEDLAHIAREKGLHLSVCSPTSFYPWVVEGRKYVRSGALGTIQLINHMYTQRVYDLYRGDVPGMFGAAKGADEPRPNDVSYADPGVVGGGAGHTQITHAIAEILFMTELKPTSAFAYMNKLDVAVDVVDAIAVRFEGGALATFSATGQVPSNIGVYPTQVIGDKGVVSFDSWRKAAQVWLGGEQKPRDLPQLGNVDIFASVGRNFVRTILGEEQLHVSTDVAVNGVKILDAAYRSAECGRAIDIA
jgi:predicted dehydrogenase